MPCFVCAYKPDSLGRMWVSHIHTETHPLEDSPTLQSAAICRSLASQANREDIHESTVWNIACPKD